MIGSPENKKRPAAISLDLDNLWSYLKVRGEASWEDYPSYLDTFLPLVCDLLEKWELKITFFVVGKDATESKNRAAFRRLSEAGHEIANHSYYHEPRLRTYSRQKIWDELTLAEERIEEATGQKPVGYRGPGFSWSPDLISVLCEKGYLYDSTTFPTFIGPLARKFYFRTTQLSREEIEERKELYGSWKDGLRTLRSFRFSLPTGGTLLEIPISTIPLLRIPFHMSYLNFICGRGKKLMLRYLKTALALCRLRGVPPNFLIHPTDLLGSDRVPSLSFFPGMDIPTIQKIENLREVISELQNGRDLVDMKTLANRLTHDRNRVKVKKISLREKSDEIS